MHQKPSGDIQSTQSTRDEQGHALHPPSREPDTSQVDLGPHHSVEPEPPVARPHVEADIDESMQRPEERDQDNMNRIGRVRPRESDTRETAPQEDSTNHSSISYPANGGRRGNRKS